MDDNFNLGYQFVMKYEFGFYNDPLGGPTQDGITQATYDNFRAKLGLNSRPVQQINDFEVKTIYYELYWGLGHCDMLSKKLSVVHFNTCVNCGVGEAVALLQRALGVAPATGYFGPKTQAAIRVADEHTTVTNYIAALKAYYNDLKSLGSNYAADYVAWINRTNDLAAWVDAL